MAEVKLVNVKKIYPFVSGEEKKSKKKKKGEEPAEEKKVNLQITDKGVVAVQEFNLDIADKEFIVLVGPSGSGKTTLMNMLSGIYQPRKDGSIRFPAALEQYLKDNPGVARIVLCLDNDGPGRAASAAIQKKLSEYEVIDLSLIHI